MKIRVALCLYFCLLVCAHGLRSIDNTYAQSPKLIRITEVSLRRLATRTVMPGFPPEARRRGVRGVSVAQLDVDEQGSVAAVQVLEAPDDSIKSAVADAIKQWKFKPSTINGEPVMIRGKLTFYYVNKNGKARVENPKLSV